ncbi:hypothetical protein ABEB36_001869 [Hypothenemus hampei]
MDDETGEMEFFEQSQNAETGEIEYLTYCLDKETGERHYYTFEKLCHTLQISNPFKISRYATHMTTIIKNPRRKTSKIRMDFIAAIIFLLPTFLFFSQILGICILTFDILLHRWCHKKNAKLSNNSSIYYQSPLHMIYKEFCCECIAEEDCRKINKIQDIRNNKRYFMQESLRRVVA